MAIQNHKATMGAHRPHERVKFKTKGPSLAKQSFKDECDINFIMKKFQKTGTLEHLNTYGGNYGDFATVEDYHTSVNKVIAAREMFAALPSSIRARFSNDPAQFLAFAQDEQNHEEMVEMGLAKKPRLVGADPVVPQPEPEPPAPAE